MTFAKRKGCGAPRLDSRGTSGDVGGRNPPKPPASHSSTASQPWLPAKAGGRGVTLMEVLVALALAVVVTLVFVMTDIGRERMKEESRVRNLALVAQTDPAQAVTHITKTIERADRFRIVNSGIASVANYVAVNTGDIQIRHVTCVDPRPFDPTNNPTGCDYSNKNNYEWDEYVLKGGTTQELEFFTNTQTSCSNKTILARSVSALTFKMPATNTVQYELTWDDGTGRTRTFSGSAIIRIASQCDHTISGGDSGAWTSLAPAVPFQTGWTQAEYEAKGDIVNPPGYPGGSTWPTTAPCPP